MGEKGDDEFGALEAAPTRTIASRRALVAGVAAVVVLGAAFLGVRNLGSDDAKTSTAAGPTTAPTTTAAGASSATHPAPDPASLPAGAILLKGESGDNIGSIAADGQARFLSLTGPGVAKGDAAGRSIAIAWDKGAGKITAFGANLHTGTNHGRYGINTFRNVSASGATTGTTAELYKHGCAVEVGQLSCQADNEGGAIVNGDKLTIVIGEEGHLDATGDFSIDWWFVFRPD